MKWLYIVWLGMASCFSLMYLKCETITCQLINWVNWMILQRRRMTVATVFTNALFCHSKTKNQKLSKVTHSQLNVYLHQIETWFSKIGISFPSLITLTLACGCKINLPITEQRHQQQQYYTNNKLFLRCFKQRKTANEPIHLIPIKCHFKLKRLIRLDRFLCVLVCADGVPCDANSEENTLCIVRRETTTWQKQFIHFMTILAYDRYKHTQTHIFQFAIATCTK